MVPTPLVPGVCALRKMQHWAPRKIQLLGAARDAALGAGGGRSVAGGAGAVRGCLAARRGIRRAIHAVPDRRHTAAGMAGNGLSRRHGRGDTGRACQPRQNRERPASDRCASAACISGRSPSGARPSAPACSPRGCCRCCAALSRWHGRRHRTALRHPAGHGDAADAGLLWLCLHERHCSGFCPGGDADLVRDRLAAEPPAAAGRRVSRRGVLLQLPCGVCRRRLRHRSGRLGRGARRRCRSWVWMPGSLLPSTRPGQTSSRPSRSGQA